MAFSAAVTEAINAASWVQQMAGMPPVSQNHLILTIQESFQRALAKSRKKKEPVTAEMLRKLVTSMEPNPSLSSEASDHLPSKHSSGLTK